MDLPNWLDVSFFISVFGVLYAHRANCISKASVESSIEDSIAEAKNKLDDVLTEKKHIELDKPKLVEFYEGKELSALENYFTAIDNACGKYIDWHVNRTRFKKKYKNDIKRLVKEFNSYFLVPGTEYKNVVNLHNKWDL